MSFKIGKILKNAGNLEVNEYLRPANNTVLQKYMEKLIHVSAQSDDPFLGTLLFLKDQLIQAYEYQFELKNQHALFMQTYSNQPEMFKRNELIIDYIGKLGATVAELHQDKIALKRWLDIDAVIERFQSITSDIEYNMTFLLKKIGQLISLHFKKNNEAIDRNAILEKVGFEKILNDFSIYEGDARVRIEALRSLGLILSSVPVDLVGSLIKENIFQFLDRAALEHAQNIGVQSEALTCLSIAAVDTFFKVSKLRLSHPTGAEDIFVRRHIVDLTGKTELIEKHYKDILTLALNDPSAYVRQGIALMLKEKGLSNSFQLYKKLLLDDKSAAVRAKTLLLLPVITEPDLQSASTALLLEALDKETDPFILRMLFDVSIEMFNNYFYNSTEQKSFIFYKDLLTRFDKHRVSNSSTSVRRWASAVAERLWVMVDKEAVFIKEILTNKLSGTQEGESIFVSKNQLNNAFKDKVARVLSVLAQNDFTYEMDIGYWRFKIRRGQKRNFRFWRFIYEFLTPSPVKRVGFSHLNGAEYNGEVIAHSMILAELTETKVPGEPLYIQSEAGWRPYLPLVEEFISCRKLWGPGIKIYSPEGVTSVTPPISPIAYFVAGWQLNFAFAYYARLRNWHESDTNPPSSYINAIRKLGFKITFTPHSYDDSIVVQPDPTVLRFFYGNNPSTS